jgi:hypothetical protein
MLSVRVMGEPLCPDHLDLLAAPGHEAAVVSLLRDWLGRPGDRLLDLKGIRPGSWLAEALPGRIRRQPMAVAPFTPLPDSPEAYRATLPTQFRKNLRVSAKRFAAEGMGHQTIRGRAVLQSLDTLRELHESQWGNRSGFLPVFDRFAAGFAGGCAADEVAVYELGNEDLVVATVTAFAVAGRVSLYQSARLTDRRWRDATTFLLAAIIDDACVRGFNESELGHGISGSPASQQSSVAAAVHAQASQAATQPSSPPAPRSQQSPGAKGATGGAGAGGSGGPASTSGTVLSSSGGTVVAQCASAGAFLLSWSPQQGFTASSVARGPATTARVVFTTAASTVTMAVSCTTGVPAAATTVTSAAAPAPAPSGSEAGDDGGGGGNKGPGGGGGGDG